MKKVKKVYRLKHPEQFIFFILNDFTQIIINNVSNSFILKYKQFGVIVWL